MGTYRQLTVGDTLSIVGRTCTITAVPDDSKPVGDFEVLTPEGSTVTVVAHLDARVGAL